MSATGFSTNPTGLPEVVPYPSGAKPLLGQSHIAPLGHVPKLLAILDRTAEQLYAAAEAAPGSTVAGFDEGQWRNTDKQPLKRTGYILITHEGDVGHISYTHFERFPAAVGTFVYGIGKEEGQVVYPDSITPELRSPLMLIAADRGMILVSASKGPTDLDLLLHELPSLRKLRTMEPTGSEAK